MAYGWHDSLGPGGPSFDFGKLEEARRRRPPRSRWFGAASASYMAALGASMLATRSLTEAHWVLLVGGSLWLLAAGLIVVWRTFRRLLGADASTRLSASADEPSWWLQPMSRRQAAVLTLPAIAAAVAESAIASDYVASAWALVAGGVLAAGFLVLAYRQSKRSVGRRRFRVEEDDSSKKWRRYRWPRGARSLR